MAETTQTSTITVALVGNPNTGKSTLFNALCGVHQRVGNYPGVTVEKKVGRMELGGQSYRIVDLPGTYSLAPRSPDEMVVVDVLLGRQADVDPPDVIVCVVDASNLERNLYLVSQVLELGRPVLVALNMIDLAAGQGIRLDVGRLQAQLGVPVVQIQANKKIGLQELRQSLSTVVQSEPPVAASPFPEAFQQELAALQAATGSDGAGRLPRFLLERLLLDRGGYIERLQLDGTNGQLADRIAAARQRLAEAGCPVPAVEAMARYGWVGRVLDGVIERQSERPVTWSDRVDRVLTHKVWGTLVFVLVMVLLFQSVFYVAEPASALIEWLNGLLGQLVRSVVAEGAFRSLLISGVIEGVGSVLVFLPQIFTLFFFIALLEDCGYMARAAYLMDKLMSQIGLSGKSFIPLLSSFACAIPGIMAARVIENRRDRLATMLVAPLMSCSARLPVYTLFIAAFIPDTRYLGGLVGLQGLTMFAMYFIGAAVAIVVALLLKRTLLRGARPPFVMELPSYKIPAAGVVLYRMMERGWEFVRRAGTLIFAVAVVVWAASYWPHREADVDPALLARRSQIETQLQALPAGSAQGDAAVRRQQLEAELDQVNRAIEGELLSNSFLGRAGRWVAPVFRPLGWDWRIGCAVIASFPAREVVVATLGVIYHQGRDVDEQSQSLRQTLREATWEGSDRPVFTTAVALSIMVFFALCAQCASTLVVLRRETGSWRWPAFTFAYMTTLAYLGALVTYQIGTLLLG